MSSSSPQRPAHRAGEVPQIHLRLLGHRPDKEASTTAARRGRRGRRPRPGPAGARLGHRGPAARLPGHLADRIRLVPPRHALGHDAVVHREVHAGHGIRRVHQEDHRLRDVPALDPRAGRVGVGDGASTSSTSQKPRVMGDLLKPGLTLFTLMGEIAPGPRELDRGLLREPVGTELGGFDRSRSQRDWPRTRIWT